MNEPAIPILEGLLQSQERVIHVAETDMDLGDDWRVYEIARTSITTTVYSRRNATIGSTADARRAGT